MTMTNNPMTTTHDQSTYPKTRGRPFAKGNPGRKVGSRNTSTLVAEALLKDEKEALFRKAIELAKGGDQQMLKFFLDRLLPRDRYVEIELPEMDMPEDSLKALSIIARAICEGKITPNEATTLSTLIETFSRAIEVKERNRGFEELDFRLAPKR
jgi:hypothetical protein